MALRFVDDCATARSASFWAPPYAADCTPRSGGKLTSTPTFTNPNDPGDVAVNGELIDDKITVL